jgi:hypothetical protein
MTEDTGSRVAGREEVAAIVHEVFDGWIAGHGAARITCAFDINTGPCSEFAEEVVDLVLARFPGTEIESEDYEDYLNHDGLTAQGIHYYVKAGGWYFDASERNGVWSPDALPTCHSIRICATSMDEDDSDPGDREELQHLP